jgi:asparagine synthase (glutamine-hydrolysing)
MRARSLTSRAVSQRDLASPAQGPYGARALSTDEPARMCGIAGILCPPNADALRRELRPQLERLATALRHRGPDAHGVAIEGGVGFAHTRLAILDLSEAGAQPMHSPDGRFLLTYNGEIYNFAALKAELERAGERFRGSGDTEVLLRLLARDGEAALARLDGMFALALLDKRSGEVLLARDRTGQKPLYYAPLPGGGLAFASELAPLLRVSGVDGALDPVGLSHLLTFGVAPSPWTLRRGIRQLRPGSLLRFSPNKPVAEARFVPEPAPLAPMLSGDLDSLSRELEGVLSDTVREHLASDVPIGVLLSGGVDSSTIAALAARHSSRLKTYAVVHRDPAYDEREASRAVAAHIGSEHTEIEFSDAELSEAEFDTVVNHHGDPFADSSSLAVLRISREMRRAVTVALSGDGGDEVFAGYPRFGQLRAIERAAQLPRFARAAGIAAASALGGMRGRQAARALHVAGLAPPRRMIAYTSLFWPHEQERLLAPELVVPDSLDALLLARGAARERDPIASAHWLEQNTVLPDDMLTKVDRMSMVHALEVRPPLLGARVLDFAARLPFDAKHSGMSGKRVLKTLARRLVPAWVVDRPKRGFALPLAQHGGAVFDDATRFALESGDSPLRKVFRPEALGSLAAQLSRSGEGNDPEDSPFRRVHRRWLLALLARSLVRHGVA